jgi:hypothetical protein
MIGVLEEAGTATARRMVCAEFHEIACPNLGGTVPPDLLQPVFSTNSLSSNR